MLFGESEYADQCSGRS